MLLLAFALILNINASSAATVNGTSSLNSSVNSDLAPTVTNLKNSVSANNSDTSTNSVSAHNSNTSTNSVSNTTKLVNTASNSATTSTTKTPVNTTTLPAAVTTTNTTAAPAITTANKTAANITTTTAIKAVSKSTTKPVVVKTNPVNNRNIFTTAPNQSITVTFNENVTLGSGWIVLINSKGVTSPFTLSINGNVLTIKPTSNLTNSMIYGVILHTGSILDQTGNPITPYVFRFGVEPKVIPKVIGTNPVNNRNIFTTAPNQSIIITFNEKVTLGSGWIVLVNSKGVNIPFKLSISGNQLTIKPTSNLTNSMIYGVILHTGSILDHSGDAITPYVLRFGVEPKTQPIPAALKPYLLPTANCQSNNPTIIALAKSITKGSTSQYTSAVEIFNWVRNNINYAFYYNSQKGALGALESRSANCCDTANLMVALERAAGIPARYEHIYAQFTSGNWYGHVIAQVYVNGKWYYADGTSYANSFGVIGNWNTATYTLEGVYASLPF